MQRIPSYDSCPLVFLVALATTGADGIDVLNAGQRSSPHSPAPQSRLAASGARRRGSRGGGEIRRASAPRASEVGAGRAQRRRAREIDVENQAVTSRARSVTRRATWRVC